MGRFSNTIQIKADTDSAGFIDLFREIMKKRGFVPSVESEATLSYSLAFSEGGWATLTCGDYRDDPEKAQDDLKYIAKELKTSAFSVEVVDSDFAILMLNSGDTVIVGDGSGYGIEEPTRGNRKYWEPLLASDKTWEQFSEITQKDSTFVEEILSELAVILGISPELICAECSELSDTENAVQLYFKKAAAKEKAMTLNTAFKKVFGEFLEPLGYKKIKSKHLYYVKVVNDEIIHCVTIDNEKADGRGDHGVKYKCFNVFCGVSTVYNGDIDFDEHPNKYSFGFDLVDKVSEIYTKTHRPDVDMKYRASIMEFYYDPTSTQALLKALKRALEVTVKVALPVIDQVVTLEKCMDYFGLMNHRIYPSLDGGDEGLLCTKLFSADEFVVFKDKYCERELEGLKRELSSNPDSKRKATLERRIEYIMRGREEGKKQCYDFFINPDLQEKAPAELERRKKENLEKLRGYGLNFPHSK